MYPVVSRLFGLVLLSAAALKLTGSPAEPVSRSSALTDPTLTLVLIQWELLLGVALLTGVQPRLVRVLAVGTFTVFAAASFYSGWIGQASCGCFGRAVVNPWLVFGFDVLAVGLLLAGRPAAGRPLPTDRFARVGLLTTALVAVVVGGLSVRTGSVEGGLARLRGEQVSVVPGTVDLGRVAGGQVVTVPVRLANRTGGPLRVVGGTSDCSCITTDDLPVELPPGGSQSVSIHLKLPAADGAFARTAWFWTDGDQRQVTFAVVGRVTPAGDAE
jgi:uncharacterized membrane protein YphA (DoxX/SURF4 family)